MYFYLESTSYLSVYAFPSLFGVGAILANRLMCLVILWWEGWTFSQPECPLELFLMLRFRKSRLQLKTLPRPCLMISRPPIPCPLSASSRVFPSLLFSHSLSGRAICEEPVRLNPAPAEASSSRGYNSEWISISSGHLITLRSCVRVPPPLS